MGILPNLGQFMVQTLLVLFVGITVGLERNEVPVLAEEEFAIASTSVILSFVVSFGFVKALFNVFGGRLSEFGGRKPLLILGWLAAIPIPLIIIWAPRWWWIIFANVPMGVNQGLAWSMTVTSKMDIAVVMFVSGTIVALWMYETAPARRTKVPRWFQQPSLPTPAGKE